MKTRAVRIDILQLEKLNIVFPDLKSERDSVKVRVALNKLFASSFRD